MTDERISYLHDFDENGNPKDIKISTRRKIGTFVGEKSQKSGQKYVLDNDGIQEFRGKGLTVEENVSVPPLTKFDGQHQGGSFTAFEEASHFVNGEQLIAKQNSISNSGELEGINLVKGKETRSSANNSMQFAELLDDMNITGGKIATAVSSNLLRDSGFDNDNKVGDTVKKAPIPFQTSFGKYDKAKQRFELELNEYKNVGLQVLLEGSGELVTVTDPHNDAQRAAFLAGSPLGLARMGAKIPYVKTRPNSVIKKSHPEFKKETVSDYYGNPGYVNGSPYNPLILFDGFSNESQAATCYLLFTSVFTTIIGIAATYEALHNRAEASGRKANNNRLFGLSRLAGQTASRNGSDNFFGLIETKQDYTDCVKRGMKAFFGFGADGSIVNSRLIINNPGYSSVILRMIVSDAINVFGNSVIGGLIPGGLPSNSNGPSGIVESISQGSDTLNKLRNSKLLKFMNIVANIGNIIITIEEQGVSADLYFGKDESTVKIMSTQEIVSLASRDSDDLLLRAAVSNHRTNQSNGGGLSWAGSTTPSAFIYTNAFKKARETFTSNINPLTNAAFVETMNKTGIAVSSGTKLETDTVVTIETQLGYSYLPFYFHDLRTNEIISFHGFLSDISDGFSTDYEATEAYGRAGSIYHYKNNKRKTSLKFWMVATNKADFDLMWYKLNRLIAMSQPMYTEGRTISYRDNSNEYKFTQPFSQIPGATPVVRVRVGDLITNNYSDVDLARLYGVGNESLFKIGIQQSTIDDLNTQVDSINNQIVNLEEKFVVGRKLAVTVPMNAIDSRTSNGNGTVDATPAPAPPPRPRRGVHFIAIGKVLTIVEKNAESVVVTFEGISSKKFEMTNSLIAGNCVATPEDIARANALRQNQTQTSSTAASLEANAASSIYNDTQERNWLRETPIFKAFESASGEGMLAVIDSIDPNFDMSSTVWEDEPGSVAPKAFEVAVGLSPMFDINPGLGADGHMIGSIYKVGRINHGLKAKGYKADTISLTNGIAEGTNTPSNSPNGGQR